MRLVHGSLIGIACACVTALVGCKGKEIDRVGTQEPDYGDKSGAGERVGTTTVTGANVGRLSNDLAIERIVAARCARETACNNIGSDKHFTDYDICSRELRGKMAADLRANECPRGIDAKELDECLESIRTESCNNPIDTISRLAACRTSDMCLESEAPNR